MVRSQANGCGEISLEVLQCGPDDAPLGSNALGKWRHEWAKPLPEGVISRPGDDGIAYYIAEIWTQNGYYNPTQDFAQVDTRG